MPRVIETDSPGDHADAVHALVESLLAGETVGVPGETTYAVAALSTEDSGVTRLGQLAADDRRFCLALATSDQARDCAPSLPSSLQRLARRCWPGPLIIRTAPDGAAAALSPVSRSLVVENGMLNLAVLGHPVMRQVATLLPAPLVVTSERDDRGRVETASDLVEDAELGLLVDAGACSYTRASSVVEATDEGFSVSFSGTLGEAALRRSACRIYLFVCTGNTCRSPLAEGMFRKLLSERLKCEPDDLASQGFLIQSAGLAAGIGSPASPESVDLLKRRGVDLGGHESQPLTEQLLNSSDHVYTMTNSHREAILRFRPDLAERVEVLSRGGQDVVDPIGGGMSEYERCDREIEENLLLILESHFSEES